MKKIVIVLLVLAAIAVFYKLSQTGGISLPFMSA